MYNGDILIVLELEEIESWKKVLSSLS
jgi:hypothetical protein